MIFVRMEADLATPRLRWPSENRREHHDEFLQPGAPGFGFSEVRPQPDELVVTKAGYDPFLAPELEADLRARDIEALTLAGAFADVCVDVTA